MNPEFSGETCVAEVFEIPSDFTDFHPGDKLKFLKQDIQDWYILDENGKMDGGFSLRSMRSKLSTKEQKEFDDYIGVKLYIE